MGKKGSRAEKGNLKDGYLGQNFVPLILFLLSLFVSLVDSVLHRLELLLHARKVFLDLGLAGRKKKGEGKLLKNSKLIFGPFFPPQEIRSGQTGKVCTVPVWPRGI